MESNKKKVSLDMVWMANLSYLLSWAGNQILV